MKMKTLALAVGLAVAALGSVGVANAVPMLQIMNNGQGATAEVNGDPSGTSYPWPANTAGGGAGLPTQNGGWPVVPYPAGFGTEAGVGNGITGFDASYLNLTQSGNVTFQFMGGGNSSLLNLFQVFRGGNWVTLFQDSHNGNPTFPIQVQGNPPQYGPAIGGGALTQNEYTFFFNAGLIPFRYITGNGVIVANDGVNNPPDNVPLPGYFLGADPYLAPGQWSCSSNGGPNGEAAGMCNVVFAGLADLPRVDAAGNVLDHDYQDMGVRVSVPEPGSIFLLGSGLLGLAGLRKRKA